MNKRTVINTVYEFCKYTFERGKLFFHGKDLINYTKLYFPHKYDSTILRSLRMLRNRGIIDYTLLDRKRSFYRINKINEWR